MCVAPGGILSSLSSHVLWIGDVRLVRSSITDMVSCSPASPPPSSLPSPPPSESCSSPTELVLAPVAPPAALKVVLGVSVVPAAVSLVMAAPWSVTATVSVPVPSGVSASVGGKEKKKKEIRINTLCSISFSLFSSWFTFTRLYPSIYLSLYLYLSLRLSISSSVSPFIRIRNPSQRLRLRDCEENVRVWKLCDEVKRVTASAHWHIKSHIISIIFHRHFCYLSQWCYHECSSFQANSFTYLPIHSLTRQSTHSLTTEGEALTQ